MNKTLYKVIFNKKRGAMVAVAENTLRDGKSNADTTAGSVHLDGCHPLSGSLNPTSPGARLGVLGFSLLLAAGAALIIAPATISSAYAAGIAADKTAPGNQQPTILQSANGTPQVNIQTPSAGGVSMNQYRQFDVDQKGAILNNSRNNTQTQIGGWIQGNPWLAGGEAKIIVNQINSSNPSLLNGYIEVAGRRAEVIMANPAGIQVNGGGFINAAGVTLTTGRPIISNGHLEGFRVRSGNVAVSGNGLDTSGADYTRILAQAAQINAGIWAKELKVVTGSNDIDATGQHTAVANNTPNPSAPGAANTPAVAIDTGSLGGMYARKITLISTDKGVGVNNAGQIFAGAGSITLSADGKIGNSGSIVAADKATAGTADSAAVHISGPSLDNSGSISAQGKANIGTQSLNNSGLIASANELNIRNQNLNNSGQLNGARLDISTASLSNSGRISQTGLQNLAINAGQVDNRNQGLIGDTPAESGGNNTGGGTGNSGSNPGSGNTTPPSTASGGGSTTIAPATPVTLADGQITVSGSLLNDKGQITANGETNLDARNGLRNQNSILNLKQLSVNGAQTINSGTIRAESAQLHTTTVDNRSGTLDANRITIQAASLDNRQGTVRSNSDMQLQINDSVQNEGGLISTTQQLHLHDDGKQTLAIDNADGKIVAGSHLAITATSVASSGQLAAKGDADIHSRSLDNSGLLAAGDNLNIRNQNNISNSGEINATRLDVVSGNLSNTGRITQTGTQNLNIGANKVDNLNGGLIGYTVATAGSGSGTANNSSSNGQTGNSNSSNNTGNQTGAGTTTGGGNTSTPTAPVTLTDGQITVSGSLLNDKGQITANGETNLNARNGLK